MSRPDGLSTQMPTLYLNRCDQTGARLMLGLALLIITYMALTPIPDLLQQNVNDKLGHALAFVLLAFLTHASWPNTAFSWRHGLPLLGYGIFLECAQYFMPGRFFSLWDVVADTAGIGLYLLLLVFLIRSPSRKHTAIEENSSTGNRSPGSSRTRS